MTIDLRSLISDDKAVRKGGFTGAIFLTYTLNLTFYEQMIAPALDQAGCANVLILVDPDGYNGALEMGLKTIEEAGKRYVCAPLPRAGRGVQHAKVLFMAGPQIGRMFIGSGNLTMHGYGRNLELYSYFEYGPDNPEFSNPYPFNQVWQLINKLEQSNTLTYVARTQIKAIQESAHWLQYLSPDPNDFRIWHNHDRPIMDQLIEWRNARGWTGQSVGKLSIISPYYDADLGALHQFADHFLPDEIQLHLDPALTNLNGSKAELEWKKQIVDLKTSAIGPSESTRSTRHVHAKAIVCMEQDGAWCLIGSANLSRPALLQSWHDNGNLELVTFHWSQNPDGFDYLFNDPSVKVWPINLADIQMTETEPSERQTHLDIPFMLTDLTARGEILDGRLTGNFNKEINSGTLHLLRKNLDIPILLDSEYSFRAQLPTRLDIAEAARLRFDDLVSPYCWVDQPEYLARHAARTYQVRIKGKMETIQGAERLFQELMNFLWDRVNPTGEAKEQDPRFLRKRKRDSTDSQKDDRDVPPPPPAEDFITEEILVQTLQWGLEFHQPYDRSLLSLRDLLSLVLLRLTTPTEIAESLGEDESRDEDADQQRQMEQEAQQVKILDRLRAFLISYCKRYGHRLLAPDFIHQKSPEVIFQNHYTLSRVLLEFSAKAEETFTKSDLDCCFWWIFAPLVWPEIIGCEGTPTLTSLVHEYSQEQAQKAWQDNGMPSICVTLICEALGQPPSLKSGLRDKKRVGEFIVAREWVDRMHKFLGNNVFTTNQGDFENAFGLRSILDVTGVPTDNGSLRAEEYLANFNMIEKFIPPIQEKYYPLVQLSNKIKIGHSESQEVQELIEQIHQQGLTVEYEAYLKRPVQILTTSEGDSYCPRCCALQTNNATNSLMQGKLVLCTFSRDAWIYWLPARPKSVI